MLRCYKRGSIVLSEHQLGDEQRIAEIGERVIETLGGVDGAQLREIRWPIFANVHGKFLECGRLAPAFSVWARVLNDPLQLTLEKRRQDRRTPKKAALQSADSRLGSSIATPGQAGAQRVAPLQDSLARDAGAGAGAEAVAAADFAAGCGAAALRRLRRGTAGASAGNGGGRRAEGYRS